MPETAVFFFTSEKKQCVHTTPHMGVLPHKGEPQIEALEEH